MIRQNLIGKITETDFRLRGKEPGRLENFSDAIFALAITLLLISTSPPTNFEQVKRFAYELLPFLLCIALIMLVWQEHFQFYLRYGLRNSRILVLNTLFLAIVLFYVYPLKFLLKILILYPVGYLFGDQALLNDLGKMIRPQDMGQLMIIYGFGATLVFLILMQMYRYALSKADELELSELEKFDTKISIRTNFLLALVPMVSVVFSFLFINSWLAGPIAGFIYFLYTPVMILHANSATKKRNALLETLKNNEIEN
ncbi:MAG: hypothetical protein BroJett042_04020 [Bacteroidota bacterium]|nr:MAG: hypothetical protein BroJett042_04020 [Bacteroidota bacterium]HNU41892.1 TMEM175 family protein [Cyclobacteriaceae bacterium]